MKRPDALWLLALLGHAVACSREAPPEPAPTPQSVQRYELDRAHEFDLPYHFEDRAADRGLTFRHSDGSSGRYHIAETIASGVALFDYDDDGRLDAFFPNGRTLPPGSAPAGVSQEATQGHALFHQEADGRFEDVSQAAGIRGAHFGVGACVGDVDRDGDLDLYVTQVGPNALFRNEGDGTFRDVAATSGVDDPGMGAGCAFFDANRDSWLDLYVANYCIDDHAEDGVCPRNGKPAYCAPETYAAQADRFWLGTGEGRFRDAAEELGLLEPRPGRGMGVLATDLDGDGWCDLYVANDGTENFYFQNRAGEGFEERALLAGLAFDINGDEQGSMGVDAGDFDRDGRLEVAVTNFHKQTNTLYRTGGGGFYTDVATESRMTAGSFAWVGWGAFFFDFDHDGWEDLFIANGHFEDHVRHFDESTAYAQPNQLLRNQGDGTFRDVSHGSGLHLVLSSRGAAAGDVDGDGDLDVLISNSRGAPTLLVNETPSAAERSWLALDLRDEGGRPVVGARVTLELDGRTLTRESRSGGSYCSQGDLRVHFGLGAGEPQNVRVRWPDGSSEALGDVPRNRLSRVERGRGVVPR